MTGERLPGRIDTLTEEQEIMLKYTWHRLLSIFVQEARPTTGTAPEVEDTSKKSKWGFRSAGKESGSKDVFLGATQDVAWLTLPLEDAIPLIPGEDLATTFWNMVMADNADAVVLRFLRARKWNEDAALAMLLNCLRWRLVSRVDDITSLGEHGVRDALEKLKPGMGDSFIENLFSNKAVIGGPDKNGRPICYINVRFHYKEEQELEVLKILCIYFMESSRMIVHQPFETSCLVFNMEGFTLANMDFDFVRFLLQCFEAYYPETLGQALIHKAPWVFSTVWSVITAMLDPVVASKIVFTKNIDQLGEFIDSSVLPTFITGEGNIQRNAIIPQLPSPGKLPKDLLNTQAYKDYRNVCEQYCYLTFFWSLSSFPARDARRKAHALYVRRHAIRAEPILRGRTHFHDAGLADVVKERLILKYFGHVEETDITDKV
ncbi:CRAL/TRIO domain-containing protein [Hesseltinella vesiculosa]|uniref:CRAL/TRIO domain-containing protein n=1 Tax=Hesseltinella vesiculosa TaxID=101127 RepID=A0A1X2GUU5_9FUNG|nr:CRAL/TRIO domain-containing protein [Hesseltinella vesiculosa]